MSQSVAIAVIKRTEPIHEPPRTARKLGDRFFDRLVEEIETDQRDEVAVRVVGVGVPAMNKTVEG